FFSSRRRHTRWPRDWSSDVCSSDLRRNLLNLMARTSGGEHEEITGLVDGIGVARARRTQRRHPLQTTQAQKRPHGHSLRGPHGADRKSTRLNSSHVAISYAVFCLKK